MMAKHISRGLCSWKLGSKPLAVATHTALNILKTALPGMQSHSSPKTDPKRAAMACWKVWPAVGVMPNPTAMSPLNPSNRSMTGQGRVLPAWRVNRAWPCSGQSQSCSALHEVQTTSPLTACAHDQFIWHP